jgi:YggT family protein
MGAQILQFLIDTVCGFFCIALLARFALQVARVPHWVWRNPLGQFIMAVTDWMVLPARRVIPAFRGYDTATVLLAVLWQFLNMSVASMVSIIGLALSPMLLLGLILLATLEALKTGLYLVMGVVLIAAIFSWVNPHAPLADVFNRVCEPMLRPFRRLIPPVGGMDLSPLALIVLVQVVLIVLSGLRGGAFALMLG